MGKGRVILAPTDIAEPPILLPADTAFSCAPDVTVATAPWRRADQPRALAAERRGIPRRLASVPDSDRDREGTDQPAEKRKSLSGDSDVRASRQPDQNHQHAEDERTARPPSIA